MNAATHLQVCAPQGDAAVSLCMPVRKAQDAHTSLHPIFQMNLPEGFLLDELQNRLAKIVNLEPMVLLALSSGQAPIGRVAVRSDFVNPLNGRQQWRVLAAVILQPTHSALAHLKGQTI